MDCMPEYLAPRRNVVYGKAIDISEAADELKRTAYLIRLINIYERDNGDVEDLKFAVSHAKDILHAIDLQLDVPGILFAPDEEDILKREELTEKYMEM